MKNSKADKEILVLSWFDTGGEAYGACKSDKRVV